MEDLVLIHHPAHQLGAGAAGKNRNIFPAMGFRSERDQGLLAEIISGCVDIAEIGARAIKTAIVAARAG